MKYSYDQLKGLLESRMHRAAREEPDSERARLAAEQYERFVAHGVIPEDFSEDYNP